MTIHYNIIIMNTILMTDELYLISSKSCPYAHKIEIILKLKNLDNVITTIWCDPEFTFTGWNLDYNYKNINGKEIFKISKLSELYMIANPSYSGRHTIPILYNKTKNEIISNESIEIIKILNKFEVDTLYPDELKNTIDSFCDEYEIEIGKNTYRAGHAKTQIEYNNLCESIFNYIDQLNNKLSEKKYIISDHLTLADVYVFPHLIRFDCVFYNLFKLNKKHLWEYANIKNYIKNLLKNEAFVKTLDIEEIKKGGFCSENNRLENLGCLKIPYGNGGFENFLEN